MFRTAIITFVAALFSLPIFAQGIQFSEGSWADIKAKAKAEKKYIFVDAYAVWCGPCKWMAKEVFTDAKVGETYNTQFINYKFDMEKGEGLDFAKQYKVQAYPTLVFFNPEGELVHKIVGAQQIDPLLEQAKVAQDPKQQLPTLQKQFAAGSKDADFLYNYTMRLSGAYEDASEAGLAYLNTQKKEDWGNEKNFAIIQKTQSNYKSEVYQYVVKNKEAFAKTVEDEFINVYIQNGVMSAMRPIIKEQDEKAYLNLKSEIIKLTGDQAPKLNAYFDMNYHRGSDKAEEYKAVYYDKFCDNSNELNSIAWNYFEKEEDPAKLEQALRWAEKSVELNKNGYNLDTKANLLNKLGRAKEALAIAEEAVKIGKEAGRDMTGTEKLVAQLKPASNVNKSPTEEGIIFAEGSWDEIVAKAKAEKKHIFVDAYAVWCGPCKWMSKNIFPDAKVGELFNKNFISYKFDMEKGEGPAFAKAHAVMAYPTLLFFNPEGELVHKVVGGLPVEQLLEQGNNALNPDKQFFSLKKKYDKGERDPEFLYNYAMTAASIYEDASEPAALYLKSQKKEDWSNSKNFELILHTQHDYNSDVFQYVTANKAAFVKASDQETINGYIEGVLGMAAEKIIQSKDAIAFKALKDEVKRLMGNKEGTAFNAKLDFYNYQGTKDEFKYTAIYLDKYCESSAELNEMAWAYFEKETNTKKLQAALRWAEKSVELQRGWANMDTEANLLYKLGSFKQALVVAKNAIELGQASGEDTAPTEKLMEDIKAAMNTK